MDDDAPLSALVQKPPKVEKKKSATDDDTPLSLLASSAKPANKAAGKPKAKPGSPAPAKDKAKAAPAGAKPGAPKRKRESSSSSSDSYTSSSSSGSNKPARKKGGAKGKVLKKKTTDNMDDDNKVRKKEQSLKESVIAELLSRWWYVLPDWPPKDDEYYRAELEKRQLRKVRIEEWEWVAEQDSRGFKKVYELSQFRGVFRDMEGSFIDVRPQESCPCYSNMMKKELADLYQLLVKAYENQLDDLKKSVYDETLHSQSVKSALNRAREKAHQASALGSVKKK